MPSPIEERPGLLIRDPMGYSDATLIVPPVFVAALQFFDGQHETSDLREFLYELTQDVQSGELIDYLTKTLSDAGFLHDENFYAQREARRREFEQMPVRMPVHAGGGYPVEPDELKKTFDSYLNGFLINGSRHISGLKAIAAPHVSPFGGVDAYRSAYSALGPEYANRTFVILGTSHYGLPDRLGLTKKSFVTPYGKAETDAAIVEKLGAELGDAAEMEDYCHAVEHSVEFQVVFLQHLFGPNIKIVPVLCGSYARSIYEGGKPEESEDVKRIFGSLGELAAREGDKLLWVLGVDMAHMGRRYGDEIEAHADAGEMLEVKQRDHARIDRMKLGDAEGFWSLVQENHDDLKWCGSAPIYTFLRAMPGVKGDLYHYQQWNIDEESVVSFAGMGFK
jgi:AmmeMemoRadiSam system protein B